MLVVGWVNLASPSRVFSITQFSAVVIRHHSSSKVDHRPSNIHRSILVYPCAWNIHNSSRPICSPNVSQRVISTPSRICIYSWTSRHARRLDLCHILDFTIYILYNLHPYYALLGSHWWDRVLYTFRVYLYIPLLGGLITSNPHHPATQALANLSYLIDHANGTRAIQNTALRLTD